MNKFFLYARKSIESEDRQVLSIEAQLAELRAFAQREKLDVVAEFIEKQSAKTPGRPIFNHMMIRITQNEATGILAWHPDRLARNSVDGGLIIHLLDTGSLCALKFPQFWYENTAQGKFMLNIAFGQSKYYVDSLAENTKRGLRQKVRRGEFPSVAPVGYINDMRTKTIALDKYKSPHIRRAFELYSQGDQRLEDIANYLAQHDIKARGGKPLHTDRISFLLSNPFYYGHFRYGGEVHEGKHRPIVSKKLFEQAQAVMNERSRPHYKDGTDPQALCGLVYCACSMMITAEHHTKRQKNGNVHRYTYYRCTRKLKSANCREPFLREEELARQLSELLSRVSLRPDEAALLHSLATKEQAESASSYAALMQDAQQQLIAITHKLQRLLDGYLEQDIGRDDYRAEKAKLLADKKTLEEQMARLAQERMGWLEPLTKWINDAESLTEIAAGSDLKDKKVAAKKFFGSTMKWLVRQDKTLPYRLQSCNDANAVNLVIANLPTKRAMAIDDTRSKRK